MENNKWVAAFGNSPSIPQQTMERYAKDVSIRYFFKSTLNGDSVKLHFSNLCGTENVTITKVNIAVAIDDKTIDTNTITSITLNNEKSFTIKPKSEIITDEIKFNIKANTDYFISFYLGDYTQMSTGLPIQGPLLHNYYAFGDFIDNAEFPFDLCMRTSYYHFLTTVDVKTTSDSNALVIFGDSITAQSYPDYITLGLVDKGISNRSIIRRGVSGSRVLGQYNAVSYSWYGLSGENRFENEIDVAGCDKVVILHGINDIIHPDGINPLRPMSNFPDIEQMIDGYRFYINLAKQKGKKVYIGTLAPIKGWRTYADFREVLRNQINDWIRTTNEIDGVLDFDKALRDENDLASMKDVLDAGDHLHPSTEGAKAMAKCFDCIL